MFDTLCYVELIDMYKMIDNYKFNIGDKVKIDTSLMSSKDIIKCKEDGILNLLGEVVAEYNVFGYIWEHEVDFGYKVKILTATYLVNAT